METFKGLTSHLGRVQKLLVTSCFMLEALVLMSHLPQLYPPTQTLFEMLHFPQCDSISVYNITCSVSNSVWAVALLLSFKLVIISHTSEGLSAIFESSDKYA